MSSLVLQKLAEVLVANGGVLSFRRFMELALYHPDFGYYMTGRARIGREGDFVTSPELTSLFGELLTLQCVEIWELLDRPKPFCLVEMGGGTGRLSADLMTTARRFPGFFDALSLVLVDTSPDFRARQEQLLLSCDVDLGKVSWRSDLPERVEHGVILGNEFLDALPIHWVEMGGEGLLEIGVSLNGEGGLKTVLIPPQPPMDEGYLVRAGIELAVGERTEVGLVAADWMREAGRVLQNGVLLLIDYGDTAKEYHSPGRGAGRLVGHRGHERIDDPLCFPGEMDLTAHVDFSAMVRAGQAGGLDLLGYTTQGWFLLGLGILERLEQATRRMSEEAAMALRQTAMRLMMPQEMGERFKVLAMGRGMKERGLSGFRLNDQRQRL
ncbi:MAG: SAM-dependent methyltransferase [Magnetococcales bacterium]|nr:SAM-dependent methyltransferase [Magnetococcales bacterium]